ncbi:MAG: GlxA family transcriptional regulator [Gammaproteobacteria bacterium]|nr:MAG: GlxA family transcriptional regulator [Gammaproteobacteria bacterium]
MGRFCEAFFGRRPAPVAPFVAAAYPTSDLARRARCLSGVALEEGRVSPQPTPAIAHFGFLTLRQFSMIAFTNAIEPLRMANYLAEETIYRWSVYSLDAEPVAASNGLTVAQTQRLDESDLPDILFVCGGVDVQHAVDDALTHFLRRLARKRIIIGALCTGSYALAKAGLLDGYRCAIHWENLSALRETFPQIVFTQDLFVVDRDRCTCTGGIAPLDLVLHLITPRIGKALAAGISDQFIVERVRDGKDRQHIPLAARLGGYHRSLAQAAALMEANIEEPLSLEELARMTEVSQRQLQRLFRRSLGLTPAQYYINLRLRRARELLLQTDMPIMSITVACGFRSPCHFSKSYRSVFGHSPSHERRAPEREAALAGRGNAPPRPLTNA